MLGVKRDDARYYKDDCDEKLEFSEELTILSSSLLRDLLKLEGIQEECKAFLVYHIDQKKINCKWTLAPKAPKEKDEKDEKDDDKDVKRGTYGAVRQACCDNDCGYAKD